MAVHHIAEILLHKAMAGLGKKAQTFGLAKTLGKATLNLLMEDFNQQKAQIKMKQTSLLISLKITI